MPSSARPRLRRVERVVQTPALAALYPTVVLRRFGCGSAHHDNLGSLFNPASLRTGKFEIKRFRMQPVWLVVRVMYDRRIIHSVSVVLIAVNNHRPLQFDITHTSKTDRRGMNFSTRAFRTAVAPLTITLAIALPAL